MDNKKQFRVAMPEQEAKERVQNFLEVTTGYTKENALQEASRCLQCKNPLCEKGCPIAIPIRDFISHLAADNLEKSYEILRSCTTLPAVCGRVCPQEKQCEERCILGKKYEPVAIGRLERYVADAFFEKTGRVLQVEPEEIMQNLLPDLAPDLALNLESDLESSLGAGASSNVSSNISLKVSSESNISSNIPEKSNVSSNTTSNISSNAESNVLSEAMPSAPVVPIRQKKVACFGSGPASLTVAGYLASRGVAVSVYEALHELGGVLVYGIPEFRLPKSIVAREVRAMESLGVSFYTNYIGGKTITAEDLFEEGYSAVFLGVGAGLPYFMDIAGENLKGVFSANEYLTRANLGRAYAFHFMILPFVGQKTS